MTSYPAKGQEDGVQADGQYNPGIPCLLGRQAKEFIPDGLGFTTNKAIPAVGAGESWFSFHYIIFVQCIIFTISCTGHAVGTGIIYIHPERGDQLHVVHQRTYGAPEDTVCHLTSPARYQDDDQQSDYTENDSQQGCDPAGNPEYSENDGYRDDA